MNPNKKLDRRAAIICSHVAIEHAPILRAVRDESESPEDSGWQFLCQKSEQEDPDQAQVWLIYEVIEVEPSLADFIDSPPGTVATRLSVKESWQVRISPE